MRVEMPEILGTFWSRWPTRRRKPIRRFSISAAGQELLLRHLPTESITVGYDFSRGMLRKAQNKQESRKTTLIEGDAAALPFADESFDVVTCSHALYELKRRTRQTALREMKRIIRSNGAVMLMEHEVPHHPMIKILFNIRMMSMGSADASEFVKGGLDPFRRIFPNVSLCHSPTGKSKLIVCRKHS
jgi:demethylphylloquinol methyltransferase